MLHYSVTIRRCVPVKTIKSLHACMKVYRTYITRLKKFYKDARFEIHYEYVDKKNGSVNVHVHMMITQEGNDRDDIRIPKGYYVDFQEVRNTFAWKAYIEKLQLTEMEVIQYCENKFNNIPMTPLKPRSNSRNEVRKYTRAGHEDGDISEDEITDEIIHKLKMTKKCLFTT